MTLLADDARVGVRGEHGVSLGLAEESLERRGDDFSLESKRIPKEEHNRPGPPSVQAWMRASRGLGRGKCFSR